MTSGPPDLMSYHLPLGMEKTTTNQRTEDPLFLPFDSSVLGSSQPNCVGYYQEDLVNLFQPIQRIDMASHSNTFGSPRATASKHPVHLQIPDYLAPVK